MQEFTFKDFGFAAYAVIGYEGDEEHVVIPENYGGFPVMVVGDNVFKGHPEIKSVLIPDAVTDIGEFVFDGCSGLKELTLPSQLSSLWGATFARCGIEEVRLPDSLRSIPPFAFKDCKSLRKIICGRDMKDIRAWAFSGCDELSEIIHGPGVKISPNAFETKEM